jgi:hypothetical protein
MEWSGEPLRFGDKFIGKPMDSKLQTSVWMALPDS